MFRDVQKLVATLWFRKRKLAVFLPYNFTITVDVTHANK